jgi:hypothetical protein
MEEANATISDFNEVLLGHVAGILAALGDPLRNLELDRDRWENAVAYLVYGLNRAVVHMDDDSGVCEKCHRPGPIASMEGEVSAGEVSIESWLDEFARLLGVLNRRGVIAAEGIDVEDARGFFLSLMEGRTH